RIAWRVTRWRDAGPAARSPAARCLRWVQAHRVRPRSRDGHDAPHDGTYDVAINATDIGTGARTALWQLAIDELDAPPERVSVHIGDSSLPPAVAAPSWATASATQLLTRRPSSSTVQAPHCS